MKRTVDDGAAELKSIVEVNENQNVTSEVNSDALIPNKKRKFDSGKDFRNLLSTGKRATALKDFLYKITHEDDDDSTIADYFYYGGSCLEILQVWEVDNSCPPVTIIEIAQCLIVATIDKFPEMQHKTLEACRYLLNTHLTLVNKMLQMSSTVKERFVTLKLLATMVTFSNSLVKDILQNVKFQVNLLTKHMDNKTHSVRDAFINFLMSFFIDGHMPTIQQLLSKPYLLVSIFPGLQYDSADTVRVVLVTLRTFIVECDNIPKPVCVKVFSNIVLKGLIHLYNWKGPNCIEEKRQRYTDGEVDQDDKKSIVEITHKILMVVCTSIKKGIIFRDETFGTGSQHRNPLMFNIIQMSFDNQYSLLEEELIPKIVVECPDLTKTLWCKLVPLLEPRPTVKWFRAMHVFRQVVSEVKSQACVYYGRQLGPLQYAQLIQVLVSPTVILDKIIPRDNNFRFESLQVKQEVTLAIEAILKAINAFMAKTKQLLDINYYRTLKALIEDHLQRNLPHGTLLLENWLTIPETETNKSQLPAYNKLSYMTAVVNIIEYYVLLCPALVTNIKFTNVEELLTLEFGDCPDCLSVNVNVFKASLVQLMILIDPALFHVSNKIFSMSLDILTQMLRDDDDGDDEDSESDTAYDEGVACIGNMLAMTGLFNDCEYEIAIWIDAMKHKHFLDFFCDVLRQTPLNSNHENTELGQCLEFLEYTDENDTCVEEVLETLCLQDFISFNSTKRMKTIKYSNVFRIALQQNMSKRVRKHFGKVALQIFHLQTDYTEFQELVDKHQVNLPGTVREYIAMWPDQEAQLKLTELDNFVIKNAYLKQVSEVSSAVFKLVNIPLPSKEYDKLLDIVKKHAGSDSSILDLIYCHPKLHKYFQPFKMTKKSTIKEQCIMFVTDITEYLLKSNNVDDIGSYIWPYQRKLYSAILKYVTHTESEYKWVIYKFAKVLNTFGLEYEACLHILDCITDRTQIDAVAWFLDTENKPNLIYYILVIVVNKFSILSDTHLERPCFYKGAKLLFKILAELNMINVDTSELSEALYRYLLGPGVEVTDSDCQQYFISVAQKQEYCRENANLAIFMFKNAKNTKDYLTTAFTENISTICEKKGLILPLLEIVNLTDDLSEKLYTLLKSVVVKTLAKPSKAGQHFENHYQGICALITKRASPQTVASYLAKSHKAETIEIFLPAIWKAMFVKYFECKDIKHRDRQANNAVMSFIYYIMNMLKVFNKKHGENMESHIDTMKLKEVCQLFIDVIDKLPSSMSMEQTRTNETFRMFSKYCLKYGVGTTKVFLLNVFSKLSSMIMFTLDEVKELSKMLFSHSAFMNIAIEPPSDAKLAVFNLLHVFCRLQPEIMERNHVPLLLSAFSCTMHPADRKLCELLRLYEAARELTQFYEFKPFLWGIAASNFYSVRPQGRNGLWRTPRTGDILDILQLSMTNQTIVHCPLNISLEHVNIHNSMIAPDIAGEVYDISFLMSVLTQLLAPEYTLFTHKFTRSGALSIVLMALACHSADLRSAACNILAKFYYHLETKRSGKDHLLWIRFVEVVSKAVGGDDSHKLNNFAAVFMARTALVLTNPTDSMYVPLSNFIGVVNTPNLNKIPELFTFMNSSSVDHVLHKHFMLQVILDGLRGEEDVQIISASKAYKLIIEMIFSELCDTSSKLLIFEILERTVSFPNGAKCLCSIFGLSVWLYNLVVKYNDPVILAAVIRICHKVIAREGSNSSVGRILETEKIRLLLTDKN